MTRDSGCQGWPVGMRVLYREGVGGAKGCRVTGNAGMRDPYFESRARAPIKRVDHDDSGHVRSAHDSGGISCPARYPSPAR